MCYILVSNAMTNCKSKSPLARLCLQTMAHVSRDGEYWEAASKLAERCGATARGVQKALAKLVAAGDVEVLERGGGRRTTRYRLIAALAGDNTEPRVECPAISNIERSTTTPEFASELHQSSRQPGTLDVAATNRVRTNKKEQETINIPTSSESAEPPSAGQVVWSEARRILPALGVPISQVGGLVGRWLRQIGDGGEERLTDILWRAESERPGEAVSWITAAVKARTQPKRRNVIYVQGVALEA